MKTKAQIENELAKARLRVRVLEGYYSPNERPDPELISTKQTVRVLKWVLDYAFTQDEQ